MARRAAAVSPPIPAPMTTVAGFVCGLDIKIFTFRNILFFSLTDLLGLGQVGAGLLMILVGGRCFGAGLLMILVGGRNLGEPAPTAYQYRVFRTG